MRFVTNKSVKLKFISQDEFIQREKELSEKSNALVKDALGSDEAMKTWRAAQDELKKYIEIPRLFMTVTIIEVGGGCGGTLEASLKAYVTPTAIVGTEIPISSPKMEIWSTGRLTERFAPRLLCPCD